MTTATSTIDTFDVSPEEVVLVKTRDGLVSAGHELGMLQRRERRENVSQHTSKPEDRVWSLVWSRGTQPQAWRVRELSRLTKGGAGALTWTPPDESDVIAVQMLRSPVITRNSSGTYSFTVELAEVP